MIKIDVLETVKKAVSQAMGADYMNTTGNGYLASLESDKIVDVGKDILDSGSSETFYGSLISQLGEMVVISRAYEGDLNSLMIRNYEWGGFVERVTFGLGQILQSPMWSIAENARLENPKLDYSSEELSYYPSNVTAKIYEEGKAIMTPLSRTRDQLKEAFRSWDAMDRFLGGLAQSIENTLNIGMSSIRHMAVQCGIASSCANGTAVHLLTEAKAAGIVSSNATANDARNSSDFLAFCLERIAEERDNMRVMTAAFNPAGEITFTPESDSKLILLNKFEKMCRFRVKANTFNKEDLAVGKYDRVSAWQGFKSEQNQNAFNFDDASSIMISASTGAADKLGITFDGENAYKQSNVIGFLFDSYAIGICPYRRKVTGKYVAVGDFYNEFHHILCNILLDPRFNMVAFVID